MATPERRFTSEDENFFRVEYLEAHPELEEDDDVVFRHVGDTGAVIEVSGQMAIKTHASQGAFDREYQALLFVTRRDLAGVPRLLADNRSARRLTLERILGTSIPASEELAPGLWHMAGHWLRELHGLPTRSVDAMTFGEAMRTRLSASLAHAQGALDASQREAIEAVMSRLERPQFASTDRVFCHRDFRPRNWMVRRDGTFVVVDFEHARIDFLETDFARLVPYFRTKPELARVFVKAYRDSRRSYNDERLRVALVVDALQTLAWGIQHAHEGYQAEGRTLLASALDDYRDRVSYFYAM